MLPFSIQHSVCCKKKDDRELIRKKYGKPRKTYFIDFLILFCFVDFFSCKIHQMSQKSTSSLKKVLINLFQFLHILITFCHKLRKELTLFLVNFVKLTSKFRHCVCCAVHMPCNDARILGTVDKILILIYKGCFIKKTQSDFCISWLFSTLFIKFPGKIFIFPEN